jgi:hypothetical protein
MNKAIAFWWVLASFAVHAQNARNVSAFGLDAGQYAVGFQWLDEKDESRFVPSQTGAAAQVRPVRIHMWYPASRAARPMRFGRYAELATEDLWPKEIIGDLREALTFTHGPLARSLDKKSLQALLQRPVFATENARPLPGRFPLIVIGAGIYYESPIAFAALGEYLAGVASWLRRRRSPALRRRSSESRATMSRRRRAIWNSSSSACAGLRS